MLKRLLAVLQYILAYVAKVDVQVALVTFGVGQLGIKQPERYVLYVRFLKVRVVQPAHDTRPALLGIGELAVRTDLVGVDVVRSALVGVETQVKRSNLRIFVGKRLAVREQLLLIYDTRTHVAQCVHVIFDMLRRVALRITEDRIRSVPRQPGSVLAVLNAVRVVVFRELLVVTRSRGYTPVTRVVDIDLGHCLLKVVDIRCTYLAHVTRVTGYKVCKLSVDSKRRRLSSGYPRYLVNGVRQPLQFGLPRAVNAPDSVCQRLAARVHFRGQRTLTQVHDRSAYHQVFGERILGVQPEQTLPLHRERGLILQLHIHLRAALNDTLVKDGHRSHRIIDRIIDILHQRRTAGGHGHTSSRNVHRVQTDLAAAGAFELTHKFELVLLGHLLGVHQRRVVQLLERIFGCNSVIAYRLTQVVAERLQYREDDSPATRKRRVAFYIVELAVRRRFVAAVQTVEVHYSEQLLAFDHALRQVLQLGAHRVVAVHDVQLELLARHARRA